MEAAAILFWLFSDLAYSAVQYYDNRVIEPKELMTMFIRWLILIFNPLSRFKMVAAATLNIIVVFNWLTMLLKIGF